MIATLVLGGILFALLGTVARGQRGPVRVLVYLLMGFVIVGIAGALSL